MDISIRTAERNDYESLLPLFRQVHNLHVSARPDLYIANPKPVEQEFFERQLNDDKQHIFLVTVGIGHSWSYSDERRRNNRKFFCQSEESVSYKQFIRC